MKKIFVLLGVLISLNSYAQDIKGRVIDGNDKMLVGATIRIKDSFIGTSSDLNGGFVLNAQGIANPVLTVSFVGYQTIEYPVTDLSANHTIRLEENVILQSELVIYGTRADAETPTAFQNISKDQLKDFNQGQDLPVMLNFTPSMVVSSDAGAGVGYTDMRIRGTDPTRINVTINGIPLNDPESQAVFWVNMPDFSSSLESVQIQRGVGTSTNGASAFGASVNLQTENNQKEAYAETQLSYGSFNTQKANVRFGTGLINDRWAFDGRLSNISSDGYVDRASSDLRSYYVSGGYYGKKSTVKLVHFSGKERTYQAWYGTPQASIENDDAGKLDYASTEGLSVAETENLLSADRRYNHYLYDNEVDNYGQEHYQLHFTQRLNNNWQGNISLHYTHGAGYFEQYKSSEDFSDYGLENVTLGSDTVYSTDLIRRRWLDNDFYGGVFNLNYNANKLKLQFGGAFNIYDGDHFGEVIWAEFAANSAIRDRYYDNVGIKEDGNLYAKLRYNLSSKLGVFADVQFRNVNYKTNGTDSDRRSIDIKEQFTFINPKAGLNYMIDAKNRVYYSVAVANREPSRSDFLDASVSKPVHETLIDHELGIERRSSKYQSALNFYYMDYQNQLVVTGELNDVGANVKTNVGKSYRRGVEAMLAYKPFEKLNWEANYTFSQNIISSFDAIVYDYTNGFEIITTNYKNTNIALSPSHIFKSILTYSPISDLSLSLLSTYVGKQFLDNTSNDLKAIDAFFVNDFKLNYSIKGDKLKRIEIGLAINNLLDIEYATKGYTYSYIYGSEITRNHYYPQATRHFLSSLTIRF